MREINFPATRFALTKEALESLIKTGIKERFGALDVEHEAYLEKEMHLLNMAPYSWFKSMIIVHNIVRNIKGVHPGCITAGRGTLAGSLVAYLLELTDVDPVEFGLSCERLYAMSNIKPTPDFDFDIAPSVMSDMKTNLYLMFGKDNVFGCTTTSGSGHKAAHACAVFLSDKPYSEYGSLYVGKHETEFNILDLDRLECEALHLFKINLLKSNTAETLMELVSKTGVRMSASNLETLPKFFKNVTITSNPLIGRVDVNFYNTFPDLVFAVGQLYARNTTIVTLKDKMSRPKTGVGEVDKILEPTYGRILYQEQVNDILAYALDTDLVDANAVRVAIQKKKTDDVNSYFCRFVETLTKKGINHMSICNLWMLINKNTDLTLRAHVVATLYTTAEIEYLKTFC